MEREQAEDSASQPDRPTRPSQRTTALPRGGEAAERPESWKIEIVVGAFGEWESDPFRFETLGERWPTRVILSFDGRQ